MCGIAGIYNLNKKSNLLKQKKIIKKMTDTIIYRGPDDEGYFVEDKIALGHRRLSILDLTSAGHQPMFSRDKSLAIVFNGEIYNYIEIRQELIKKGYNFITQTDTEVILASYKEWGVNCQKKFNGMWAFVIYDRANDVFFASRDRFGVKPFYYYLDQDKFIFASEIKAILVHPQVKTKPNDQVIRDYLVAGMLDYNQETFFTNILELRGGHYLLIKKNILKIEPYWHLKSKNNLDLSDDDTEKKFLNLFTDSVKLRLRSDVPIGTCLSGGLDSSAIACVANNYLKKEGKDEQIASWQRTFSACYDPQKFPNCDERPFIEEVIKNTGAHPTYVFPQGRDLIKEISQIIWHHDAPVHSTSVYAQWNVFRLAKNDGVKVMLDGQGADEYLAGYLTFFPYLFTLKAHQKEYFILIKEIIGFLYFHGHQAFYNFFASFFRFPLIKVLTRKAPLDLKSLYQGNYFDISLFNKNWLKQFRGYTFQSIVSNSLKNLSNSLLANQGLPMLLRYEDRDSMAFSIESRTPFLDYRLVEFVYNLPEDQKIRFGQTKWVMRQALKNILPKKISTRQDKVGFNTPEEIWFKTNLAPVLRKVFRSKSFASRVYFDAPKIVESFDHFLAGDTISHQQFWRIYSLELWLRQYFDKS